MLDTGQFEALAMKYMDAIYRLAFSFLKSTVDADDVTQEVLLRLYRTDREFESEPHIKNWLMKVTVNECRKVWRRPFRAHENIDDYIEALVFEDRSCRDLFDAILRLDKVKRLTVVLYYVDGYSIKEIAEILDTPAATIGTRLARARKELARYLKEEESI